jgi:transcription elongation factor Elf1
MGSVIDYIECPRCEQEAFSDYYYKTGEEYINCNSCGYHYSFVIKRDEEGNMIKIDESKDFAIDNVVREEKIFKEPYCAYSIEFDSGVRSCGRLESEKDYNEFVSDIVSLYNQEHNMQEVIVSRFADGKINREVIYKKN